MGQKLSGSCLKIKSIVDGKEQTIIGTIIATDDPKLKMRLSSKQIVISKSSMVGENPVIVTANGQFIKCTIIAQSRKDDLVILGLAKALGRS
ncbi:hypothetical protein [Mucilaginibacter antarcticus]|uniref:hypothetical protein n=1 Tax=Mucilaginibacter antarcticus TaxID=1855725 RepID=UPI00362F6B98